MLMTTYLLDFLVLNKLLYGTTIEQVLNDVFTSSLSDKLSVHCFFNRIKNQFMFKLNWQYITRIAAN
ncbi:hypothetical protein PNIG_a2437 [Pseudoalteromonas nigrifaciens]|uniref:Uncharacterized protein n=1 Tax=Pseudoalteromonas nigrifaciens TaxID=28109 RepID=A0AAC9XXU3_9GAMM|nr:hypothetical protein PNIG_a2437 [Pseudoalteromonas nigrifaciens]